MAVIKPFKAIRYNDNLKGFIGHLVSPPYDVYENGDETDKRLKGVHYNFSHIIKPHGSESTRYENAKKSFDDFLGKKVLIQEETESFYIYEQSFGSKRIIGIVGAVKLEDYKSGVILRHEMVKTRPVNDRKKLLEKLKANTALIYTVFKDTGLMQRMLWTAVKNKQPAFDFKDAMNIGNKIWIISDKKIIDILRKSMNTKKLYIADGHHRYETALANAKKYDKRLKGDKSQSYVLSYMVPDTTTLILPYNRVIYDVAQKSYKNLLAIASKKFHVKKTNDKELSVPKKQHEILMYYEGEIYLLSPKKVPKGVIESLDVSILQENLLSKLGFTSQKLKSGKGIKYIKGDFPPQKMRQIVLEKDYAAAFSLYPVTIRQLEAVADANRKNKRIVMPPKSTYFYPKPYSGIVSYKF